jgi:uncharacterized membrane protein YkoI
MNAHHIMAALALCAAPLAAQNIKTELPDSLVAKAKVTEAAARKTAMAKIPKGTPTAVELEREKGKLQYSYDFTVPGETDITEVNVDAITGKVLGVQKEKPGKD